MTWDVNDAAIGVWQSLRDQELKDLTPQKFYPMIEGEGLSDEEAEDAWDKFEEIRSRVFGK